jgi:hypothetical protein
MPPSDWPTTTAVATPKWSSTASASATNSSWRNSLIGASERPKQRRSIVRQVWRAAKLGSCCHQVAALEPAPCRNSTAGPSPWRSAQIARPPASMKAMLSWP